MRVISQDRTYSVDFDRTPFWCQNKYIYARVGKDSFLFGAYGTIDRMKEVFQEMHNAYVFHLPEMPKFEPGASRDDMIALLNDQIKVTPAVLHVPHDEGCECIYNPYTIYFMPEE